MLFIFMKLIIGIGNPGKKFEKTRHNVGWLVLDKLKQEISKSKFLISNQTRNLKFQFSKNARAEYLSFKLSNETIELIKPLTFMNKSGFSVAYARNKHKVPNDNIYIIHDDLDIKLGEYKIQKSKGPREHKGVLSIEKHLGTNNFWRVRVGIDNDDSRFKNHDSRMSGEKYVLEDFAESELEILEKTINNIVDDILARIKIN